VDPALIGKSATQEPALRKSSRFRPISFCSPLSHAPRSQHEYNSCQYSLPWSPVDPDVGGNGDAAPSEFHSVILPLIWDLHSDCGLQWRGVKGGSLSFSHSLDRSSRKVLPTGILRSLRPAPRTSRLAGSPGHRRRSPSSSLVDSNLARLSRRTASCSRLASGRQPERSCLEDVNRH
jgi:hypothetical protein